jgi:hypothetical protein
MIELRLHRALYQQTAVDQAVAAFGAHGTFERQDDSSYYVVRVAAKAGSAPEREQRLANELGNWALGLTIRGKRTKESAR